MKALLTVRRTAFPRTHDLVLLANLTGEPVFQEFGAAMRLLSRYGVEARYPGDSDAISLAEASQALRFCDSISRLVQELLPEEVQQCALAENADAQKSEQE